jgi:hypothetical protein
MAYSVVSPTNGTTSIYTKLQLFLTRRSTGALWSISSCKEIRDNAIDDIPEGYEVRFTHRSPLPIMAKKK